MSAKPTSETNALYDAEPGLQVAIPIRRALFKPTLHSAKAEESKGIQYVLLLQSQTQKEPRAILLKEALCTVGRGSNCTVKIQDKFVSRHHAYFVRVPLPNKQGYTYCLFDGDKDNQFKPSTNGVFVNGQRIASQMLTPEDVVHFGPQVRGIFHAVEEGLEPIDPILDDAVTEQEPLIPSFQNNDRNPDDTDLCR